MDPTLPSKCQYLGKEYPIYRSVALQYSHPNPYHESDNYISMLMYTFSEACGHPLKTLADTGASVSTIGKLIARKYFPDLVPDPEYTKNLSS